MNILLTGSGGFIGKNLKSSLSNKYNLFCPRSYELDLCNEDAVKNYFNQHDINFIIHCATVGGIRGVTDEDTTVRDNLLMVNNLIKAKNDNVKIIFFGSGAMYGKDRNLHKVKETEIGNYIPKDLYGQSKLEISKIVKQREDILMLNIFACYGYDEKASRFPSYAINQILENKPVEIEQNVVFDYLWIEDLQKIVSYFIKNETKDKIINVTPSESVSLKEIAKTINKISNKNIDITIKNEEMNYEYTGDNSLLLKHLQGFKFTKMEIGLNSLYNYKKARRRSIIDE